LIEAPGPKVERVGIYSLKDLILSWIPGKYDRKNGRTMQDYIDTSLRFLEETVLKLRSGDFSASPLNDQICRNCPERPYCPYIQKTVTDIKMSLREVPNASGTTKQSDCETVIPRATPEGSQ
jgi:hypothetical protein